MTGAYVHGIGMTKFGKLESSLKELLLEACTEALNDAGRPKIDAVYIGNFMGGSISNQEILGAIVANAVAVANNNGVSATVTSVSVAVAAGSAAGTGAADDPNDARSKARKPSSSTLPAPRTGLTGRL